MADIFLSEVLQRSYDRLIGDGLLATLVGDRIYNHIPQDTAFPYIRFYLSGLNDWSQKDTYGYDGDLYIHCWSDKQGDKEVLQILDAVQIALVNQPLNLTSGQNVCLTHQFTDSFIEPDGQAHHGLKRFRLLLSEN